MRSPGFCHDLQVRYKYRHYFGSRFEAKVKHVHEHVLPLKKNTVTKNLILHF